MLRKLLARLEGTATAVLGIVPVNELLVPTSFSPELVYPRAISCPSSRCILSRVRDPPISPSVPSSSNYFQSRPNIPHPSVFGHGGTVDGIIAFSDSEITRANAWHTPRFGYTNGIRISFSAGTKVTNFIEDTPSLLIHTFWGFPEAVLRDPGYRVFLRKFLETCPPREAIASSDRSRHNVFVKGSQSEES